MERTKEEAAGQFTISLPLLFNHVSSQRHRKVSFSPSSRGITPDPAILAFPPSLPLSLSMCVPSRAPVLHSHLCSLLWHTFCTLSSPSGSIGPYIGLNMHMTLLVMDFSASHPILLVLSIKHIFANLLTRLYLYSRSPSAFIPLLDPTFRTLFTLVSERCPHTFISTSILVPSPGGPQPPRVGQTTASPYVPTNSCTPRPILLHHHYA